MYPETDFPDSRCWTFLHSKNGTLMNIPREGDMMRYYIQLPPDTDFINQKTGRIDKARATSEKLIETAAKIFHPYTLKQVGQTEWWTIYISEQLAIRCHIAFTEFYFGSSWSARRADVFGA